MVFGLELLDQTLGERPEATEAWSRPLLCTSPTQAGPSPPPPVCMLPTAVRRKGEVWDRVAMPSTLPSLGRTMPVSFSWEGAEGPPEALNSSGLAAFTEPPSLGPPAGSPDADSLAGLKP